MISASCPHPSPARLAAPAATCHEAPRLIDLTDRRTAGALHQFQKNQFTLEYSAISPWPVCGGLAVFATPPALGKKTPGDAGRRPALTEGLAVGKRGQGQRCRFDFSQRFVNGSATSAWSSMSSAWPKLLDHCQTCWSAGRRGGGFRRGDEDIARPHMAGLQEFDVFEARRHRKTVGVEILRLDVGRQNRAPFGEAMTRRHERHDLVVEQPDP